MRTGGRILVDQLELNGADLAFCLPGESYLPVLDALYDSPIRLVTCRHEQGAANAAEAYGKLTGRPGICLVTRGPGATQAAVGVHTAKQDSSPMLLLVGQVPRAFRGREAWQELDYAQVFGGIAKAAWEIDGAERIPEHMAEAYAIAISGRPGPVVLALPEDVLAEQADVADGARVEAPRVAPAADEHGAAARASGGGRAPSRRRRRGRLDGRDEPRRAGVLRGERAPGRMLRSAVRTTWTTARRATSVCSASRWTRRSRRGCATRTSCSRSADGSARCRRAAIPCSSRPIHGRRSSTSIPTRPSWVASTCRTSRSRRRCRRLLPRYERSSPSSRAGASGRPAPAGSTRRTLVHEPMEGDVDLGEIQAFLRARLPGDAVQTCGAGNFTVWAHRFARFTEFGTQACPRSGSMGYGLPAAVAAQLVHPDRVVVCFTGDGDFVMSSPELATAVQYGLPIVVLLVNNGMYATIRMHQERTYPRRVIGTDLSNPDFPALAHAYGAHAERVERTEDFEGAFERALASGKPAVLELPVDPERISPRVKLSDLRGDS